MTHLVAGSFSFCLMYDHKITNIYVMNDVIQTYRKTTLSYLFTEVYHRHMVSSAEIR